MFLGINQFTCAGVSQFWSLNESFHDFMIMLNLVTQILILALLLISLRFKKKRNYVWHGNIMLVAVIISLVLLIMHMVPSLLGSIGKEVIDQPFAMLSIATILHVIFGGTSLILGLRIVVPWAYLQGSRTEACYKRRRVMTSTFRAWILTLILGIMVFILHIASEQ